MIRADSGLTALLATAPVYVVDRDDRVTLSNIDGWYFVVYNDCDVAISSDDPFELLQHLLSSNDPDDRRAAQLLAYHLVHHFFSSIQT